MIKCNVTVNGVISRAASVRTGKEGKVYISFAVKVNVSSKDGGSCKTVEVSVLQEGDGNELAQYSSGTRVELKGSLTFRKTRKEFLFQLPCGFGGLQSGKQSGWHCRKYGV